MQTITSTGQTAEVPDGDVEDLVVLVADQGLTDIDLDDLVHDCCDLTATDTINALGDDVDCDAAIEEVSRIGSQVNNLGVAGQVAFLLAELGTDRARQQIQDL